MRRFIILLLVLSVLCLQGCGVALVAAGVGAAIGMGRAGSAKVMEAKAKYMERYETYNLGMEEINLEREKAGLEPRPIKEFDAWLDEQPLTPEEVKLFRKYPAQTPEEIKEAEEAVEEPQENTQNFSK